MSYNTAKYSDNLKFAVKVINQRTLCSRITLANLGWGEGSRLVLTMLTMGGGGPFLEKFSDIIFEHSIKFPSPINNNALLNHYHKYKYFKVSCNNKKIQTPLLIFMEYWRLCHKHTWWAAPESLKICSNHNRGNDKKESKTLKIWSRD